MNWTDYVAAQVETNPYKFRHKQDCDGYKYYWFLELGIVFRVFQNGLEAEVNGAVKDILTDDSLYRRLLDHNQQLLEESLEARYE